MSRSSPLAIQVRLVISTTSFGLDPVHARRERLGACIGEGPDGLKKQEKGSGGQTRVRAARLHGCASGSPPMGGRSCPKPLERKPK